MFSSCAQQHGGLNTVLPKCHAVPASPLQTGDLYIRENSTIHILQSLKTNRHASRNHVITETRIF